MVSIVHATEEEPGDRGRCALADAAPPPPGRQPARCLTQPPQHLPRRRPPRAAAHTPILHPGVAAPTRPLLRTVHRQTTHKHPTKPLHVTGPQNWGSRKVPPGDRPEFSVPSASSRQTLASVSSPALLGAAGALPSSSPAPAARFRRHDVRSRRASAARLQIRSHTDFGRTDRSLYFRQVWSTAHSV